MKRAALLILLCMIFFTAAAYCIEVSTYTGSGNTSIEFKYQFENGTSNTIYLLKDIVFTTGLGNIGTAKEIDGNGKTLYGRGFSGLSVNAGNILLTLKNVTLQGMDRGVNISTIAGFFRTDGSVIFSGNSVSALSGNGGGLFMNGGAAVFAGTSIAFNGNSAYNGGAIYSLNSSSFSFSANSISFSGNTATILGGAVYVMSGRFLDFGGKKFEAVNNNVATSSSRNRGGFLYISGSNATFRSGYTNIEFNIAGSGGGIYASGSGSLNFSQTELNAYNNRARAGNGGFLYLDGTSGAIFGRVTITSNTASVLGGAVYSSSSSLYFSGSNSFIGYNTSSSSGGAIYIISGRTDFLGSGLKIESNKARGGGFLSSGNSSVNFHDSVTASNNEALAGSGGFLGALGSSAVNFYGMLNTFNRNLATESGGALYAGDNSRVTFSSGVSNFTGNRAGSGGAVSANNAEVEFYETVFKSNIAGDGSGGAIAGVNGAEITLSRASLFSENKAKTGGGAVSLENSSLNLNNFVTFSNNYSSASAGALSVNSTSTVNYSGGLIKFEKNYASNAGGAVYISKTSSADFGNAFFVNNRSGSGEGGGAVFVRNYSSLKTGTADSVSEFLNNTAQKSGGAVYITIGSSAEFYNTHFYGNKALTGQGGAIYIDGSVSLSSMTFRSSGGNTVFQGNTAEGVSNAIHLGGNSSTYFIADAGYSVEMYDALSNGSSNISLTFGGQGDFNLYTDISIANTNLNIYADGGGSFNLKNDVNMTVRSVINRNGSLLNMRNNEKNEIRAYGFSNNGEIVMDAGFVKNGEYSNDTISASGAVALGNSSVLRVYLASKRFDEKEFKIINYGTLTGSFGSIYFDDILQISTEAVAYGGRTMSDWITIIVRGKGKATDFVSMPGLARNQKAAAGAYDKLSAFSAEGTDLDNVINIIDMADTKKAKDALTQASGYFLANVIRSGGSGGDGAEIYDRIKSSIDYNYASNGLWAQLKVNAVTNKADENSPNDYQDTILGFMAGYDKYFENLNMTAGFFGKFNKHDITQDYGNTADISGGGIGIYGGYIENSWELKGLLSGNFDSYSTARSITFIPGDKREAEADFSGIGINFDIEGALKIDMKNDMEFRPYAGMEISNVNYGDIEEKGAQSLDINVSGGSYNRFSARFGAGINKRHEKYSWYLDGEYRHLLIGDLPETENSFEETSEKFTVAGSQEGQGALGVKLGGSLKISENARLYANAHYFTAERYDDIYANLGIRWSFFSPGDSERWPSEELETKKEWLLTKEESKIMKRHRKYRREEEKKMAKEIFKLREDSERSEKARHKKEVENADKKRKAILAYFEESEKRSSKEKDIDKQIGKAASEREKARLTAEKEMKKEEMRIQKQEKKKAEKAAKERLAAETPAKQTRVQPVRSHQEIEEEKAVRQMEKELQKEEKRIAKEEEKLRKEEEKIKKEQEKLIEQQNRLYAIEESKTYTESVAENERKVQEQRKIEDEIAAYEAKIAEDKRKEAQRAKKLAAEKARLEQEKKLEAVLVTKAVPEQETEISDYELKKKASEAAKRRFRKILKTFTLKYTPDNYKLVETSKMTIREQAEEIKKLDYGKIVIEGHTDSQEAQNDEGRKELSRMRAKAVYDEFIKNGIPSDKLSYTGLASELPIGSNDTDKGKIDNRRVEIVVE